MATILLVLALMATCGANASRILFLPYPSFSHINGQLHIASELVSRGHEVWFALTTKLANDKRLQIRGINILRYKTIDHIDLIKFADEHIAKCFESNIPPFHFEMFKSLCDLILKDDDLFERIKRLSFDLTVLDATPLPRMLTIIPYRLNIPFIFYGAVFEPLLSRTPTVVASNPSLLMSSTPVMTFGERLLNTISHNLFYIWDPFSYYGAVRLYAPEKPYLTMEALTARGLLWLTEQEPLLDYPKALLPNVKHVGSISATMKQDLPQEYNAFLDNAKNGAVIVSFGSQVKKIPEEIARRLLEAFSQTKYKYVFRTEMNLKSGPDVMITKWMPQAALLSHPNTKLFITHCGANGQNEAFVKGVPMIGFPIFAEQRYNAARIVYHGFGLKMDLKTFQVEELVVNINEVIQNSTYSTKIKKMAKIAAELRPRSPTEESVYWIEHVMKYGGDHLRSYCQDMPLYQYLNLDVIGLLIFILHLSLYLIWKLCCCCVRACRRDSSKLKTKKD